MAIQSDLEQERVALAQARMLDRASHQQIAETFRALADTTRSKIVYSLLWQDLCTTDLAAIMGTSESAVSQHLRILRQLRIVKAERHGKMVFYSLDDEHIRTLLSVSLSHVRDAGPAQAHLGEMLVLLQEAPQPQTVAAKVVR